MRAAGEGGEPTAGTSAAAPAAGAKRPLPQSRAPGQPEPPDAGAPDAGAAAPQHISNERVEEEMSDFKRFCRAWAWKREHRPDKERFDRPYRHTLTLAAPAPPPAGTPAAAGAAPDSEAGARSTAGGAGAGQRAGEQQQRPREEACTIVIKQQKFGPEGFAST